MYNSYNTSNKSINKSKKYNWYDLTLNNITKKPVQVLLPPLNINCANKIKNSYKYNTTSKYFNNKLICDFMIKKNFEIDYKKKFFWEK